MFVWSKAEGVVLPISLLIILVLAVGTYYITRNKSQLIRQIPLMIISTIMLALEIAKQIISIVNGYSLWSIPLHFCSLFLYFFPLASFAKGKLGDFGRTMSFACGTLFLVLFYINPGSIIGDACANIFTSFSTFHTFIYHHLITLFYLVMLLSKIYKPTIFDFLYVFIGITVYAVVAIPLAHILNVNFCSLLTNVVPFLEAIRLQVGQVFYTIFMYLCGIGGGLLAVGLSNLVKYLVNKNKKEKDSFEIIMHTIKHD